MARVPISVRKCAYWVGLDVNTAARGEAVRTVGSDRCIPPLPRLAPLAEPSHYRGPNTAGTGLAGSQSRV